MPHPAQTAIDHFICLPNSHNDSPLVNPNDHLTDASDHIYAVVNTSSGPQRARILTSGRSNRESSGSVISCTSIASSSSALVVDPHQGRSASISSTSLDYRNQPTQIGSTMKLVAPNLIDLIPPPPSYPPPATGSGSKCSNMGAPSPSAQLPTMQTFMIQGSDAS